MTHPAARVELDPLLQELESVFEGPAVVAIGGGHGLSQALQAILGYAGEVTAVVGVADDGGSSGRLTAALDIPPPGDIRRCLLALTPEDSVWRDLLEFRFTGGDVAGHSMGNLILAALTAIDGDFERALRTMEITLGAAGTVVPVARHRLELRAVIDGREVKGQLAIARARGELTELQVLPEDAAANPRALDAVKTADQIVVGPGSLYTSVTAPLLVPGLVQAINDAPGQLVYVCNLITQDGETLGMDATDHVATLVDLAGLRPPDAIVADDSAPAVPAPNEPVRIDPEALRRFGSRLVVASLADPTAEWPVHDPGRLAMVLERLAVA